MLHDLEKDEPGRIQTNGKVGAGAVAPPDTATRGGGVVSEVGRQFGVYSELSKFRLSALVVSTAGAGFAAGCGAWGGAVDPIVLGSLCSGTFLAATSANTFNQVIERPRDVAMKRTCNRPLPSGRITPEHATGFGVAAGAMSCCILGLGASPTCAALGAANIGLYALPYTLSKPRTEWNTWVGALVGAIPPLMGWSAAGLPLSCCAEPWLLASTLFLWQFPHFFSLAWLHRRDYARGGFQMVPVNDPTGTRTADLVLWYSAAMLPLPAISAYLEATSYMFAVEGTALTGYLVYLSAKFRENRSNDNARHVFRCSLWFLPLFLGAFLFHQKSKKGAFQEAHEAIHAHQEWVEQTREYLRKMCVHEVVVQKTDSRALCPNTSPVDTQAANAQVPPPVR